MTQRERLRRLLPLFTVLGLLLGLAVRPTAATTTSTAATTLISQDRPATASSAQNGGTPAGAVDDGDTRTRWSSLARDPQWVQLDLGGTATLTRVALAWESSYGYSLYEFQVFGSLPRPAGRYVLAAPQVTGVTPSSGSPAPTGFHQFQANCTATHDRMDDPIVHPGQPGASHLHTFLGNTTTDADSTLASLQAGGTACKTPGDRSAYWVPSLIDARRIVDPEGPQVIYYKSGVRDYTSVRPFPPGLRFVVGSPEAGPRQFLGASVRGFECGNSYDNADIPTSCPAGTQLNVRYQAPSCWDGTYLDTPNHQDHMAYPVDGRCTAGHSVPLPMIELKIAFPVSGDLSKVRLSSGRGYSFHYDFYDAWDPATLAALVDHCVRGGLQCDARGYDQTQPGKGAALTTDYRLP